MKNFLSYLWKHESGLVIFPGIFILSGIMFLLSGSDLGELDIPFWLFAILFFGYSLFFWNSYKEYKKYYSADRFTHLINETVQNAEAYEYISPITNNEKVKDVSKSGTVKIEPPETFFSIPRKVDWDELNKTRKYNGDLGEVFVYDLEKNYLTKIGRSDLAEKVQHVSKDGDGHGYDIKSFYENGVEKFIEVKSTSASSGSTFNMSKNEFNFLQTHLDNAVVYHVHNVTDEHETTITVYTASAVINSPDISPSGYVVKM